MEAQLDRYLVLVEGGEDVLESRRREMAAQETRAQAEVREHDRLLWLERTGEVRRGSGDLGEDFWDLPMPEDPEGLVLKALLEDRD